VKYVIAYAAPKFAGFDIVAELAPTVVADCAVGLFIPINKFSFEIYNHAIMYQKFVAFANKKVILIP